MFKRLIQNVNREMHIRPVLWVSAILATSGYGMVGYRMFRGSRETNVEPYVQQNEINMRTLFEREFNYEMFHILETPKDRLPVEKRHVWQMAGEAEKVYHQLNTNQTQMMTCDNPEQIEQYQSKQQELYQQWRSQIYDLYWSLAEQRGIYTPERRKYLQTRQFQLNNLPDAKPWSVREYPHVNTLLRDATITAPAPDAPREEFVKYYALRYNVDLKGI